MPTEFKDSDPKFKVGDLIKVRPGQDYSGFAVVNVESDPPSSYRVNHDSVLLVVEVYTGWWFGGDQNLYQCLPVGSQINVRIPQSDIHHFMHANE